MTPTLHTIPSTISGPASSVAAKDKKLWKIAEDFESVFLGSMFGEMTKQLSGDGPLGGQGTGGDAWRGMLTDELGKSVAKSGGVGIAPSIYSELIRLQANHGASA